SSLFNAGLLSLDGHLCSYSPFLNTPTTEIYTLSLHDALPISFHVPEEASAGVLQGQVEVRGDLGVGHDLFDQPGPNLPRIEVQEDRKSTRLNSSHVKISYAVFCLKKKTSAT